MIMRKLLISLTAAAMMVTPVHAAGWQDRGTDVRPGAFVGAQVKMSFGGSAPSRPRAALAIAPTQSRISSDGMIRTRVGEGIALNLAPSSKPSLTIAGVRADTALGLRPNGQVDADRKLGVSSAGWVAIGVGVVALAAGAYFLYLYNEAEKNSD